MGMHSDFKQNLLVDGFMRGGALDTTGANNSTAITKGIRTASTAYSVGDIVVPASGDTGAGGKFLRCTTAGTSAASGNLAIPNPGSTVTDGTVTWTAVAGVPAPVTGYVALLKCSKGARANSTAYALNDTIAVTANDSKIHLYKCTTAGTTAASQSTLYPGVANEAITDGTAVFTEQTAGLDAGTAQVEPSGGSYARASYAMTKANWAGTQSSASTTASTGTGGQTSNNNAITYASAPSADWNTTNERFWGWAIYDNATGGNVLDWGPLNALQQILNGQAAPSFAAGSLVLTEGI